MQLRIPADALAFEKRFATETACRRALLRARFPFGFRCPRCGGRGHTELRTRRAVQCRACKKQVSLTAGTLFHGTHLELPRLFRIVYLVVAEKDGTNALAISRQLGVSYPTALLWMRKVRAVMARRKREKPASRTTLPSCSSPAWAPSAWPQPWDRPACVQTRVETE